MLSRSSDGEEQTVYIDEPEPNANGLRPAASSSLERESRDVSASSSLRLSDLARSGMMFVNSDSRFMKSMSDGRRPLVVFLAYILDVTDEIHYLS